MQSKDRVSVPVSALVAEVVQDGDTLKANL